ncbi:MAG TPA: hypothetical protein VFF27_08300 [Bacteroidia bacterium]|jgi:hypothetical protein|nr:hypothetical protein [Bacteroidia bacterium]
MNQKLSIITILICLTFKTMMAQMVGGDKDKHGCRASAGYTFSVIKKECIRVFEQQVILNEVNPADSSTSISAVIFSDDKKKAEIFIPGSKASIVLSRKGKEGGYVWKKSKYALVPKGSGYSLKKADKIIFESKA